MKIKQEGMDMESLPELSEIKSRRNEVGLTQTELARAAHISQSLLAKIEAGKLQPAYNKAKRLFDALEQAGKRTEITVKDAMSKHVLYIQANDRVKKAIQVMENNAVSQVPVLSKDKSVGLITEKGILELIKTGKTRDLGKAKVKEIMEESLPVIAAETPLKAVYGLLGHQQALLVAKNGKIVGILTKSDLLKSVV